MDELGLNFCPTTEIAVGPSLVHYLDEGARGSIIVDLSIVHGLLVRILWSKNCAPRFCNLKSIHFTFMPVSYYMIIPMRPDPPSPLSAVSRASDLQG